MATPIALHSPPATAAAADVPDLLSMLVQRYIFGDEEEEYLTKNQSVENKMIRDEPVPVWCGNSSSSCSTFTEEEKLFFEIMGVNNMSSPLDVFDSNYDDQSSEFINGLPHRRYLNADEFGASYLPDSKSIAAVENFWARDDRKKRYLSHLRDNYFIDCFINGTINAKTCVGMLRSMATEYGYRSIYNVAKMVAKTVAAEEEGKSSPNNSFCVEAKNLLCSDERPGDNAATAKKPDSLHPLSTLENSEIFRKMKNPTTKGVSLDWSETAAEIDATSCRKVAVLTNLICAIVMPAYTFDEVVALSGEAEHAILHRYGSIAAEDTKDVINEMCVLACIHSLVQYFSSKSESSTHHLFSAPLRLPSFDKHPVVNLRGSKFFFPDQKVENVVATMSVPAHSTLILNYRNKRRGKKIVCQTAGGITAHILPPKPRQSKSKTKKEKRDPFLSMDKKDRPLLLRNVLILSGNYGWFGLTLGHIPSPDILFAENNCNGLFPPGVIRRYRNKTIGVTPFRNRHLDLRFWGVEITETIGYTSCFRIRPASLCKSNNISPGEVNNKWTGNVVEGSKNPFVTRMGYPQWYSSKGLSDIFGKVDLKDHVAALDHTMDKFVKLVEDQRWKANQEEKVSVLKECIALLTFRLRYLANKMDTEFKKTISDKMLNQIIANANGEAARSMSSNSRRRQVCNNTESAIIAAQHCFNEMTGKTKKQKISKEERTFTDLQTAFKHTTDAISLCCMLKDECQENSERFFEGECRIAAYDLYKYIYRNSARQYIRSSLIRGVKMSVLWRRPYDECADNVLADVPRCRIPQLIVGVENIEEKRRIEGKGELLFPGLQIFNTRDVNPKPMRHILLSMIYGKEFAKDISAMNCLEWMNWCTKTVGEKTEKEELTSLVRKRSLMYNNTSNDYSKKRRREEEEDTSNIISEILCNESMPVYDILFPAAIASKRRGTKNEEQEDEAAREEEEEEEEGEEDEEKISAFVWPPKKRTVRYTKKKLLTTNKMRTGRLGYKDVYIVALTSLPQKLSNVVNNVATNMGFQIPNL